MQMFGLGTTEIILVVVMIIVVFGASRLPQIGKSMGEGIKNFKKSVKDVEDATDITPIAAKKEEEVKDKLKDHENVKEKDI